MKKTFIIPAAFILFLLIAAEADPGVQISDFHASRDGNAVLLEWVTESESNLLRFDIQRSTDQRYWLKIGENAAIGESSSSRHYSYRDDTIFKTGQSNFYYRLVVIDKNQQKSIHSVIASIAGSSGIRHTWGSIKAMFR
ncbi:hypothetical protein JW906_03725 [bacterium]|nr:hypothetical protein [bacterium]